jgi:hypothetical protein
MRILFNHLHKTGGLTVCHHLAEMNGEKAFTIDPFNPNRSIRYFASLPESDRHSYKSIAGHNAIVLAKFVHPKTLAATVLRDPVERVVSLYRFCLMHPGEFLHRICKTRSLARCVNEDVPGFRNYYAHNFNRDRYSLVSLSPEMLLRTSGYFGKIKTINRSEPFPVTDEDIAAAVAGNQVDIAIYNEIKNSPRTIGTVTNL